MRDSRFLSLTLAAGLALFAGTVTAASDKSADAFGLTKVWSIHLTIAAKDWQKMEPTRKGGPFGGFGPGRPNEKEKKASDNDPDRKPHGMVGFDFAYVKATLEIDGKTFKDVGVRFKGNFTFAASQGQLKRPFKIDMNRYVEGQNFKGLKKLTLNNNVADPTMAREVLSYAVYRALEVPASRTAYAKVTLTIPGKHDKVLLGIYTFVESVDKVFLKDRFGSAKGLLLKPERAGPLPYLGEDWKAYPDRYGAKNPGNKKSQQRFIDLTRLIHKADDKTFNKEIGAYLDTDEFLRYLAGTVALASMDSFIGMGHNYYLYLDPKSNKIVMLPWDLDLSFGTHPTSTPDQMMDLSIRQPQSGTNRLIERLLADEKLFALYKGHLKKVLDKGLTKESIKKDLQAINAVLDPLKEQEKKAVAARRERTGFGMAGMLGRGPALDTFVAKRIDSIKGQLAGERKGTTVRFGFGPPGGGGFGPPGGFGPGMFIAKPILKAAAKDTDGKLSREEAIAAIKLLFKTVDKDGKGELDQKTLAAGIDKLLPGPPAPPGGRAGRPGFPGGRPMPGFPTLGTFLARSMVEKAGTDGKVTEAKLVALAGKLFAEADKNKDGKLDEKELIEALNRFMPRPQFGPPGGGPPAAKPADKDRKEEGR